MDHHKAEEMLSALGTVLEKQGTARVDIVICGAMVLLMQGTIARPTRDIDVLGLASEEDGAMVLSAPVRKYGNVSRASLRHARKARD